MKKTFIPKALRPNVAGSNFSISIEACSKEIIDSISNIDEIINLSSRRKIIANIIKNLPHKNETEDSYQILSSMFFDNIE